MTKVTESCARSRLSLGGLSPLPLCCETTYIRIPCGYVVKMEIPELHPDLLNQSPRSGSEVYFFFFFFCKHSSRFLCKFKFESYYIMWSLDDSKPTWVLARVFWYDRKTMKLEGCLIIQHFMKYILCWLCAMHYVSCFRKLNHLILIKTLEISSVYFLHILERKTEVRKFIQGHTARLLQSTCLQPLYSAEM